MMLRSVISCVALFAVAAGTANAAQTTSATNIKAPPVAATLTAADCTKSGGTVVTKNGVSTCVYADGRKGRGLAVGRGGGSF